MYQDSYGYSPYKPQSYEPEEPTKVEEVDSYGYSPYKPETTAKPITFSYQQPKTEKPVENYNFPSFTNSYFDVQALEESFSSGENYETPSNSYEPQNSYEPSYTPVENTYEPVENTYIDPQLKYEPINYREPIQPMEPKEPKYEPVVYEPQTTTPSYSYPTTTTTTTTTYKPPTTTTTYSPPTTKAVYTPGPVYYKPLPPVEDKPKKQKQNSYNTYDTIYYKPAPEVKEAVPAVPSDHESYDVPSSFPEEPANIYENAP